MIPQIPDIFISQRWISDLSLSWGIYSKIYGALKGESWKLGIDTRQVWKLDQIKRKINRLLFNENLSKDSRSYYITNFSSILSYDNPFQWYLIFERKWKIQLVKDFSLLRLVRIVAKNWYRLKTVGIANLPVLFDHFLFSSSPRRLLFPFAFLCSHTTRTTVVLWMVMHACYGTIDIFQPTYRFNK